MFGKIWKLLMPHGSMPPGLSPAGSSPMSGRAPRTDQPALGGALDRVHVVGRQQSSGARPAVD